MSGKDWDTLASSSNIEENWSTFKDILTNLANIYLKLQSLTSLLWWSVALRLLRKSTIFIKGIYIPCLLMTFILTPNKGV